ncbi:nucleotidyltransferase domain-containing protein [Candidatus Dependentiae bacterium]|nr:nucleotidyltransferase domain-containing protein [Candidatus Dependentiae bacterium]
MESEKERFNRYKKILLDIIHKQLPGCKVYLYGSRARSNHRSGSDIDIALDMGKPIDDKIMFNIRDKIEETVIPLNVDLVDFYTATGEFRKQIEEEGVLWKK